MKPSDYIFSLGKVKYLTKTGLRNMLKLPQYSSISADKKEEIIQGIGYNYKWTDTTYVNLAYDIMCEMYQNKELEEHQELCVVTTILSDLMRYSVLQIDMKPKTKKRGGK